MRFTLRCVFYLSIVYAAMAWSRGVLPVGNGALPASARDAALSLAQATKEQAADYCRRHASECLAEAAKLGALFSGAKDVEAAGVGPSPDDVPLPVRDPRRRGHDARLAATR